jgi:hypothetical protein
VDKNNAPHIQLGIIHPKTQLKILPLAATWVKLEGILLCEIIQVHKHNELIFLLFKES